jgi:hypothetical protein
MKDIVNIAISIIKSKFNTNGYKRYKLNENVSFNNFNNRIDIEKSDIFIKNIRYRKENILFGSDCKSDIKLYETSYGYFIQPTEKVYKYQFEELFLLGCCNYNYKKDKTIFIPK